MRKLSIAILATLLMQGCQTAPNVYQMSEREIAYMHRYSRGEFDSVGKLTGLDIGEVHSQGSGSYSSKRFIRSLFSEDGSVLHQIYLTASYTGDWRFYGGAALSGGEALKFTSLDRSVTGCPYRYLGCNHQESMVAEVTEEHLAASANSGLRVSFQTRYSNISTTVDFPPAYISSYLKTVASVRSQASYGRRD